LIRLVRLNPQKHSATPYSGLGAVSNPGRWNLLGVPMVYTSGTESLAFLELFVHLPTISLRALDREYEVVAAEIDKIDYVADLAHLPHDWRDLTTTPASTQQLGTDWMKKGYLVVSVPSVVFPSERNYLINPKHLDFSTRCQVQPAQAIFPDPRILGKLK
jgi:RES domain-containing protein